MAGEIQAYAPRHPGMLAAVAGTYAVCSAATTDAALKQAYAEKALAALDRAIEQGYHDVRRLEVDPDFVPLHQHPGYKSALTRLGKQ